MRKLLSLVLVLVLTLSAVAAFAESKGKVAGVVFEEDQFVMLLQMGYKDAAEAAGYEFFPANTNNDAAKEFEFINTYVDQGFKGIAISPISEEASIAPLTAAAAQGLKIALSNSSLGGLDWMIACYTSDNYNLGNSTGKLAAEYIKKNFPADQTVNIGILQFKTLLPEQSGARSSGFMDAVKELPNVVIVDDQDAWLQDKAITAASDMLTAHPEINILWSANEGGTIGSTMAIKNAGLAGKVVSFGTDAGEQMSDLILSDDNILQAVTGQDPYNIGVLTMKALIQDIETGDFPQRGELIIVPGVVLTREDPEAVKTFRENFIKMTGGGN